MVSCTVESDTGDNLVTIPAGFIPTPFAQNQTAFPQNVFAN